jgi:hypothetical protein
MINFKKAVDVSREDLKNNKLHAFVTMGYSDLIRACDESFANWANRDESLDYDRPLIPHIKKNSPGFTELVHKRQEHREKTALWLRNNHNQKNKNA